MIPNGIDLLLTDVILPREMNGREVAGIFRSKFPNSGVLFSSGYTRNILNNRGNLEDGAELINKPYQASELAVRVRDILDSLN